MNTSVSKKRLVLLGAGLLASASVVWFVGVALEFEYPYCITLYRASHAKTATGEAAADVIARTLKVPRSALDWHRCSYCKVFERELPPGTITNYEELPPGTIRVQVSSAARFPAGSHHDVIVPADNFVFAFDSRQRVLYPGDERTESKFPTMPRAKGAYERSRRFTKF